MDIRRQEKLVSSIQQIVMQAIILGEIKDPRVTSEISITEVVLSKDLSLAKIYISSYLPRAQLVKSCEGLNSAAGIIRNILGKTMQTKNTPKPFFIVDDRLKEEFYLGQKIVKANREAGISAEDVKNFQNDQ
jgi:ribosome-binding factor A